MHRKRIVFWQGSPSPHQSSYLRALADILPEKAIVGVFAQHLAKERLALGWRVPDLGRMEVVVSPREETIAEIALLQPEDSIHIFDGLRIPMVKRALAICSRTSTLIGVLSEARHWHGWRGKLRVLHSHWVERLYRNRVDFVLAIGHLGVRWYEMCGYPSRRIFSWAYFVEKERLESEHSIQRTKLGTDVVISYVGRCVAGKGIDTLLRALSMLRAPGWSLQIVGDGPQRQWLEQLASKFAIAEKVRFFGVLKNVEVWNRLAQTDLFVFPSQIDGWGAVVNEALMSGVPVVCSDYCGAADLICASGFGETFQADSAEDLARVLDKWIRKGHLSESQRREIRAWSRCIEGEAAARYLIEVIAHIDEGRGKPVAPWLREKSTAHTCLSNNEQIASHVRTDG